MIWPGHTIRMKGERLTKIYETRKPEGCRKRAGLDLRALFGFERWQSANKGSVKDHLGRVHDRFPGIDTR